MNPPNIERLGNTQKRAPTDHFRQPDVSLMVGAKLIEAHGPRLRDGFVAEHGAAPTECIVDVAVRKRSVFNPGQSGSLAVRSSLSSRLRKQSWHRTGGHIRRICLARAGSLIDGAGAFPEAWGRCEIAVEAAALDQSFDLDLRGIVDAVFVDQQGLSVFQHHPSIDNDGVHVVAVGEVHEVIDRFGRRKDMWPAQIDQNDIGFLAPGSSEPISWPMPTATAPSMVHISSTLPGGIQEASRKWRRW